ncbi:hypothetical protein [Nocardia sp. JCM 34519]|uniref:hypothetical protein n=1 Tax=Nocardia sp. JCM 34519 TaxID=2876118 RepID=UPI001CE3E79B|nr:hypothetical protein [Nocardia sp. JCM 34519]
MAKADRIRTLDPCGLVDRAAAAQLGTVNYVGGGPWPDGDVNQCDVGIDAATGFLVMSVQLTVPLHTNPPVGNRVQLGDLTGYISAEYGCKVTIPTESMIVTYAAPTECPALQRLVSFSAPMLHNPPTRADSKLGKLDPCETVAHVSGSGLDLGVSGLASSCRSDAEEIKLQYIGTATRLDSVGVSIDGIPVVTHMDPVLGRNCEAVVYLGYDEPHAMPAVNNTTSLIYEIARITGFMRGCDSVNSDAAKLIASYRRAR